MKIVGMLRVKNEARWIARVVRSLRPLCAEVFVMDDNSEDDTREICAAERCKVLPSPFSDFNETRDKNWMLSRVYLCKPEWMVMIDGDEILEEGAHAQIAKALRIYGATAEAFSFEVVYLWNDEQHIRTDLRTFCRRRASMFRYSPGRSFQSPYPKHGLHCGNIPQGLSALPLDARLLHLGYMHKEDRLRKWAWYNKLDPANHHEDCYRHMIIGDTEDLPAAAVTRWGGPLKLEPLTTKQWE